MPLAAFSLTDSPSQRRAKIVATLGPASNTEPVFRNLVRAGVDVVRLNFSHGSHEGKLALIQMIRKVSREEHKPLCILGDLQGPKIRTSKLKDHQAVLLKAGVSKEAIQDSVRIAAIIYSVAVTLEDPLIADAA